MKGRLYTIAKTARSYWIRVPMPIRTVTYMAIVVVLVALPILIGTTATGQPVQNGDLATACEDRFGESWGYTAWMDDNPPFIKCKHPNGSIAYMDMPKALAQERGVVSADWNETRSGQINLSELPTRESETNNVSWCYDDKTNPFDGSD